MTRHALTCAAPVLLCGFLALGVMAGQKPATRASIAKGKEAFEQCLICHAVDSNEKKLGPSLKGLFKRAKLQNGKPVNNATVLAQINQGGNGMPPYADILSTQEKADIMAYLHTL
jgi:mono/diheme cytochrome c family protein